MLAVIRVYSIQAMQARPFRFTSYPPGVLEKIAVIVQSAAGGLKVNRSLLEEHLLSCVYATGTAHDGSETSMMWHEAGKTEPRHKQMAAGFRRIADAPRPLDHDVCTSELRPELNGKIHNRWSARWRRQGRGQFAALGLVVWDELSDGEKDEIRDMARQLAHWHMSLAPAHRPHKIEIHTLLGLLADVFIQHTGFREHADRLSHSINSRFIRFLAASLKPFFAYSEVTESALAARWMRRKLGRPTPPARPRRSRRKRSLRTT